MLDILNIRKVTNGMMLYAIIYLYPHIRYVIGQYSMWGLCLMAFLGDD